MDSLFTDVTCSLRDLEIACDKFLNNNNYLPSKFFYINLTFLTVHIMPHKH